MLYAVNAQQVLVHPGFISFTPGQRDREEATKTLRKQWSYLLLPPANHCSALSHSPGMAAAANVECGAQVCGAQAESADPASLLLIPHPWCRYKGTPTFVRSC